MKSTVLWVLVGLNALLLILFVGQFNRPNVADAQFARPHSYLLIPGNIPGGQTEVVYILDTTDGILGGMGYSDGQRQLQVLNPINLNQVYHQATGK